MTNLGEFRKEVLMEHNAARTRHAVPPLVMSEELNRYAQEWADKLVSSGKFCHRQNLDCGENIFNQWSSATDFDVTGKQVTDTWYNESKRYTDYGKEPTTISCGHITQVVWASSRQLGVGKAKKKDGTIIVVANYKPAGNIVGQFKENVKRQL